MKRTTRQYIMGNLKSAMQKWFEKRIKQDFWIHGKLVVIDNVPAAVCSRCGAKVVRAEIGKRLATILQSPKTWSKALVMGVPVVEFRPYLNAGFNNKN